MPDHPDTAGLEHIFDLDPAGWAPTVALHRVASEYLAAYGTTISSQQLTRLLKRRGFVQTTRRGRSGFRGFAVSAELAAQRGRFVPEHSEASYRRGDRSPEAKRAKLAAESRRDSMFRQQYGAEFDVFTPAHEVAALYEYYLAEQAHYASATPLQHAERDIARGHARDLG